MSRHADYYLKTKQDPDKLAALRARRAKNQRERRAKLKEILSPPNARGGDKVFGLPSSEKGSDPGG